MYGSKKVSMKTVIATLFELNSSRELRHFQNQLEQSSLLFSVLLHFLFVERFNKTQRRNLNRCKS